MNILVCGYARHGKDTFCEIMVKNFKIKFISSSEYCLHNIIWPSWGILQNYSDPMQCFADRINHRSTWFDLIAAYNMDDKARLARDIFSDNDIYCGMRNVEEFNAAKAEGLIDLSIWVDASKRLPPEPDSSCTITPDMCDIVVDNNGTLEQLESSVNSVGAVWFTYD